MRGAKIWRVADAAAQRAGKLDLLRIARRAGRSRGEGRRAGDGVGKRDVGLDAEQPTRRRHIIVAGLETREIAAHAVEGIEAVEQVERAVLRRTRRSRRHRRPTGRTGGVADMAADIDAGPIIGRRAGGGGALTGRSAAAALPVSAISPKSPMTTRSPLIGAPNLQRLTTYIGRHCCHFDHDTTVTTACSLSSRPCHRDCHP